MLVGINAHLVSFGQTYRNAGVSRYTYLLLQGLSELGSAGDEYLAFINRAQAAEAAASPLGQSARLRLVPGAFATGHPALRIAWEQAALPGALRRHRVEVFHAPVNVLPPRLPCPAVVTVHDLAFYHFPHLFRPARRLYQQRFTRASIRRASLVVAVSESTRRDVLAWAGIAPERVCVIYPCLAPDFATPPEPAAVEAFRARHNLPARYLLYLGTLEPRKNIGTLLEAYARLRAQQAEVPPLVLAGARGWYYQPLFEQVRSLGLEPHVTFAGYVAREEQPLWYAGAELFLYVPLYEGFGLPVAEALACGTPTITSNVSSLPEAGGPVARQVDPRDAEALAHAMHETLADATLRGRVRTEGPLWTQRFSVRAMAEAYHAAYARVAQTGNAMREEAERTG